MKFYALALFSEHCFLKALNSTSPHTSATIAQKGRTLRSRRPAASKKNKGLRLVSYVVLYVT